MVKWKFGLTLGVPARGQLVMLGTMLLAQNFRRVRSIQVRKAQFCFCPNSCTVCVRVRVCVSVRSVDRRLDLHAKVKYLVIDVGAG